MSIILLWKNLAIRHVIMFPYPVFLPGESQGWGSLLGCRLRGRAESDTTEATQQQQELIGEKGLR